MKKQLVFDNKTLVMGILNVTPDSFSDGGLYFSAAKAVLKAKKMIEEGADIIDVGGESTRPGSIPIPINEEIDRVLPVIKKIRKLFPKIVIAIDSYKLKVVRSALLEGIDMINSMGGFSFDPNLAKVVKEFNAPIIIYHIKGKPKDMQKGKIKYKNLIGEIMKFFKEQIKIGEFHEIKRNKFIIDPGIGFGKTVDQNIEIIRKLSHFSLLKLPIAIGVSRKSHLGIVLQSELNLSTLPSPAERLEASLAETAVAVINGAKIVRTHDVLQTKKFLAVLDKLKNEK